MHKLLYSLYSLHLNIPAMACWKVASDLGLCSGFHRVLWFPLHLQLASHILAVIWQKKWRKLKFQIFDFTSIFRIVGLPEVLYGPLVRSVYEGIYFKGIPPLPFDLSSSDLKQTMSPKKVLYFPPGRFVYKVYLFCVKYLSHALQSLEAVIHHIILYMP